MIQAEHSHALLRELAHTPGGAWVTCAGRSMEPTVRLGERVRIRACPGPRTGEVVLFETFARDALVLHRVVAVAPGGRWFLHLGDAGSPVGPRFARIDRIVGRADLPRRTPDLRTRAATARAVVRGLWRLARKRR